MIKPKDVSTWRYKRQLEDKPSGYMDFWEWNCICFQCKGMGQNCPLCLGTGKWGDKHDKIRYNLSS